jgi:hypothetical protein
MYVTDERVIELSKAKLLRLLLVACALVILGILMLQPESEWTGSRPDFNEPALIRATGLFTVAFFGLCALLGVQKLFEKKPGLVLNSTGILDNSSGIAAGLIPWSEIVGFDIFHMPGERSLVINVIDPDKYVNRGSTIRRVLNKANVGLSGSPIAIASNSLKIDFDDLLQLCNAYLKKYRGKPGSETMVSRPDGDDCCQKPDSSVERMACAERLPSDFR